jgi:hypothetical protein
MCPGQLQVEGRATDDPEYVRRGSLLLPRLVRFAGKSVYLPLQVGSGWGGGRCFASLGPIRAPNLDRLLTSTALPHFAPLGRVTTRLKLIQILSLVPWQDFHSGGVLRGLVARDRG